MLGKPKYKQDDVVHFKIEDRLITGIVYIVDAYGVCEVNQPSYDIIVEEGDERILFKHIPESYVFKTDKEEMPT